MSSLLLDPHGDDAVLFSCFNLLRHRPRVIVVLRSQVQEDRGTGITAKERELETAAAMDILGASWEQWDFLDRGPDWATVSRRLYRVREERKPPVVFAPAFEAGGHDHHNALAEVAADVFGPDRIVSYLTYVRGVGRSGGVAVDPDPEMIVLKHRALACFASQIREPSTRPWFMDGLAEYVSA